MARTTKPTSRRRRASLDDLDAITPATPAPPAADPAAPKRSKRPAATASARSGETVRLGIAWPSGMLADLARGAFFMDRFDGGPDSLAGWIDRRVRDWAALTPAARDRLRPSVATDLERGPGGGAAGTASFVVPKDLRRVIVDAITQDARAGVESSSVSAFVSEAAAHGVVATRARNGGVLQPRESVPRGPRPRA